MNKLGYFVTTEITPLLIAGFNISRPLTSNTISKQIEESYKVLNIPLHSKQDVVHKAFLELAKKFHPDSGCPEADIDKFISIESAFRTLSKHNTGATASEEVEQVVHDIKHTAPQHRQYLSYEGTGYGSPFQRQKQWEQARARKAASNVMEHRVAKAVASENTLLKKGQYSKKHDIKTRYGFDRLVEDLIQESISKGEFDNLSGKGKPIKDQNTNPYVDFTTHKLNEVLINNGFTPEWITMTKEIDEDINLLKEDLRSERKYLGPHPLSDDDTIKWQHICDSNRNIAKSINTRINTFNLIVPLLNKQKFHVDFEGMCKEVLTTGPHSVVRDQGGSVSEVTHTNTYAHDSDSVDIFGIFFKGLSELLSFSKDKKNVDR